MEGTPPSRTPPEMAGDLGFDSEGYRLMFIGDCAQCGEPTEDEELMDFGPYKGQLVCAECWDATQPRWT